MSGINLNGFIQSDQNAIGLTAGAISGSAPQVVNGATRSMTGIETGTLSAKVYYNINANNMTITGKWQVSDDGGSNWYDCSGGPHAPANVAIYTGTGSPVTGTIIIPAPDGVYGHMNARYKITSGAASGGGAGVDEVNISYSFRFARS